MSIDPSHTCKDAKSNVQTQPISNREIIAFHEAAHAVVAIELGLGLLETGIDIARVEVTGGVGLDGCRLFLADLTDVGPKDLEDEQRRLSGQIDCNGTVLAAGPASDARLREEDPWLALHKQPADLGRMRELLTQAQLAPSVAEEEDRLRAQLAMAVEALKDPAIWSAIQAVAQEILERGSLAGPDIAAIVEPILEAQPPSN